MSDRPVKEKRARLRKPAAAFHHGDLRAAALVVAARDVEALGHQAVTLERIAATLGVTRPALYRHFADRDALLLQVTLAGFVGFAKALADAFRLPGSPWERLRAGGRAYVRHARAHRGWFRLQFSQAQTRQPESGHQDDPPEYFFLLFTVIQEAFATTDEAFTWKAFRTFWAQVHGLASVIVEDAWAFVPEEQRLGLADESLDAFVDAMQAWAAVRTGKKARSSRST